MHFMERAHTGFIFNDKRSESITGKHTYQRSRIGAYYVDKEITTPTHQSQISQKNTHLDWFTTVKNIAPKRVECCIFKVKFTYAFHFINSEMSRTDPNYITPCFPPLS